MVLYGCWAGVNVQSNNLMITKCLPNFWITCEAKKYLVHKNYT